MKKPWQLTIAIEAPGDLARVEYTKTGAAEAWTRRVPTRALGQILANLDPDAHATLTNEWVVSFDALSTEAARLCLMTNSDGSKRALWVDAAPTRVVDVVRVATPRGIGSGSYYHDEDREMVRMTIQTPPLLWDCRYTTEGRLSLARLYITEVPVVALDQVVKALPWPWGNIYSDGHVCWGNDGTPDVRWGHPKKVDDVFFGAPFNTDLSTVSLASAWGAGIGWVAAAVTGSTQRILTPAQAKAHTFQLSWGWPSVRTQLSQALSYMGGVIRRR